MTFTADCPDWDDAVLDDQEADYWNRLLAVCGELERHANSGVPDCDVIRHSHLTLFGPLVPIPCYAGRFRHESSIPGNRCLARNVRVGTVPGAHFQVVPQVMESLCTEFRVMLFRLEMRFERLNRNDQMKQLAAAMAFVVGEFIRIHPFINGNGRTSRLLWFWCCRRFNIPPQVRIHPRPDRQTNYDRCMREAMQGNDSVLAMEILRGLGTQANFHLPRR